LRRRCRCLTDLRTPSSAWGGAARAACPVLARWGGSKRERSRASRRAPGLPCAACRRKQTAPRGQWGAARDCLRTPPGWFRISSSAPKRFSNGGAVRSCPPAPGALLADLLQMVPELRAFANLELRVVFNKDSSRVGPRRAARCPSVPRCRRQTHPAQARASPAQARAARRDAMAPGRCRLCAASDMPQRAGRGWREPQRARVPIAPPRSRSVGFKATQGCVRGACGDVLRLSRRPMQSRRCACREWIQLARVLHHNRSAYDAFLVVHGTDTMAYTASALSLMLLGFKKPIVLTGAGLRNSVCLSGQPSTAPGVSTGATGGGVPSASRHGIACVLFCGGLKH
jgi:Asparaginase, N-terminal